MGNKNEKQTFKFLVGYGKTKKEALNQFIICLNFHYGEKWENCIFKQDKTVNEKVEIYYFINTSKGTYKICWYKENDYYKCCVDEK